MNKPANGEKNQWKKDQLLKLCLILENLFMNSMFKMKMTESLLTIVNIDK